MLTLLRFSVLILNDLISFSHSLMVWIGDAESEASPIWQIVATGDCTLFSGVPVSLGLLANLAGATFSLQPK